MIAKRKINRVSLTAKSLKKLEEKISQLSQKISEANQAYHTYDSPNISDAQYDSLKQELSILLERYPDKSKNGKSLESIGGEIAQGFEKVKHSQRMLSLNNGHSKTDILNFCKSVRNFLGFGSEKTIYFCSEPKIDGLSLSLRYEYGKLVQAITRGDGDFGENVTKNSLGIKNIPKTLMYDHQILEVRGEVYLSKSDFLILNKQQEKDGKKLFANPRNAAAGSLRQLDAKKTKNRNLAFFAYSCGEASHSLADSQFDMLMELKRLGFSINPFVRKLENIEELLEHYKTLKFNRSDLDYDIDGMVYKVNDLDLQQRLGSRATSPRWAIAHKFPAETAITSIVGIDIQVSRTGSLSPVARLRPVNIGGVLISNATLHNPDYISGRDSNGQQIRNGVDIRIGDFVEVFRAGDVIPKVNSVIIEKRPPNTVRYVFPDKCPTCNSKVVSSENDSIVRCPGGVHCSSQAIERVIHFVSKKAFNIDGFGRKHVELLYDCGWISDPSDIFFLNRLHGSENTDRLQDLSGWGVQSAEKLFVAIENSRAINLSKLIFSFGIRYVGEQVALLLEKHYLDWNNFFDQMINANAKTSQEWLDLCRIDGIGEKIAFSIVEFFSSTDSAWISQKLMPELVVNSYSGSVNINTEISGMIFAFTGKLEQLSRSEAKFRTEELGGKVVSSVSKTTNFLVVGSNGGSKIKKAKDFGVKILSETEWIQMISDLSND